MKVIVMEEMSKLKMSKEEPLDLTNKPINLNADSCNQSEILLTRRWKENARRMKLNGRTLHAIANFKFF